MYELSIFVSGFFLGAGAVAVLLAALGSSHSGYRALRAERTRDDSLDSVDAAKLICQMKRDEEAKKQAENARQ